MLGRGVDRPLFEGLFGLDHARLRQGAEDLLRIDGALGQALFEAGAGISGLARMLEEIEKKASDLFTPRKVSTKRFYIALDRFAQSRRQLRDSAIGSDEWREVQAEIEAAERRLADHHAALRDLDAARARAERLRRVLPLLTGLDAVETELAALGDVPDLPEGVTGERDNAERRLQAARTDRERCGQAIDRVGAELSALPSADPVLGEADRVVALHERRSEIRSARAALPQREIEWAQLGDRIAALLARIGLPVPVEDVRSAIPSQALVNELRALVGEDVGLRERRSAAEEHLDRAEAEVIRLEGIAAALRTANAPDALQAAVMEIRARGDMELRLTGKVAEAERLAEEARLALSALGLFEGDGNHLAGLPVPDAATVERFESRFSELAGRQERLNATLSALRDDAAKVDAEILALNRAGEVPDGEAVAAARRRRDLGWRLIRRRLEGGADPEAEAAYTAGVSLQEAFERAMLEADVLADRREAEADRVAHYARLCARREELRQRSDLVREEEARLAAERAEAHAAWGNLWRAAGILPRDPRDMLGWLSRRDGVMRVQQAAEAARREADRLAGEVGAAAELVSGELARMGEAAPGGACLALLLRHADSVILRHAEAANERKQVERRLAELRAQREAARRQVEAAGAARAAWSKRWGAALAVLGWPPDASPAGVEAGLGLIEDLDRTSMQAERLSDLIAAARADGQAFEAAVLSLCRAVAPDLSGIDPVDAAGQLFQRLARSREDAARRADLQRRLAELREELARAERQEAEARAVLQRLQAAAGVEDTEALGSVIRHSARKGYLQAKRGELVQGLLATGDGLSLAALREEAAGTDPDKVAGILAEIARAAEERHREGADIGAALEAARRRRHELERGRGAVRAAEDAQEALATLRDVAEEYVRLKAAAVLLRRAVERYREEQQGPLLGRASVLFRTLTQSGFAGLRVDYDDRDHPLIKGERAAGGLVDVAGMSDGTRDQLFLALRLAAVERYAAEAEPLPFVADDLLVNFDDHRSGAAFEVLGELSASLQVLFFTHHPHLCEVARERLGPNRVHVHRMGA